MYKQNQMQKSTIKCNDSLEGESIERKVRRITQNKEPITDGAPEIYQSRAQGVEAGYDIRTDRFEIAIDAMDKVQGSIQARRDEKAQMSIVKDEKPSGDGSADGAAKSQ